MEKPWNSSTHSNYGRTQEGSITVNTCDFCWYEWGEGDNNNLRPKKLSKSKEAKFKGTQSLKIEAGPPPTLLGYEWQTGKTVSHKISMPWGPNIEPFEYEITCKAMIDSSQVDASYVTGDLLFITQTKPGGVQNLSGIWEYTDIIYSGKNVGTEVDSKGRTWVKQKMMINPSCILYPDEQRSVYPQGGCFGASHQNSISTLTAWAWFGWRTTQANQVAFVDDVQIRQIRRNTVEKDIKSSYNIKSISGLNESPSWRGVSYGGYGYEVGKIRLDFCKPMEDENYVFIGVSDNGTINIDEKNKNYITFSNTDQSGILKNFNNCDITIH
jgi:hypothetical protein